MDAQRAQIWQIKHTESCNYVVYQNVTNLLKGSQWTQTILNKGGNEGVINKTHKYNYLT